MAQLALKDHTVLDVGEAAGTYTSATRDVNVGDSPALALQASLAEAYDVLLGQPTPEPKVWRWPGWARVGFILTAAVSSWALVIWGVLSIHR